MTAEHPDLLDRLIAIRKWRGLTQQQVADRMFITRPAVSQIEGRTRDARLDFLEAYARAVGAEFGAWPIPIPEPPEVKRPPRGAEQVPFPGVVRNGDGRTPLSAIRRIGADHTRQLRPQHTEAHHVR